MPSMVTCSPSRVLNLSYLALHSMMAPLFTSQSIPKMPSKIPNGKTLKVAAVGYSPSLNCSLPTMVVDYAHFPVASFIESLELLCKGKLSFLTHAGEIKELVARESINKWKPLPSYLASI